MTTAPFEINGKTFTRTLHAANHLGGLIADIDTLLNDERDPAAMASLLDERAILYTTRGLLVGSMCEATRTETPEQTATAATTGRRECPQCGSTFCAVPHDSEPDGPTHEDLEGAVNMAVDASEACEHCAGDIDSIPELSLKPTALNRVRRLEVGDIHIGRGSDSRDQHRRCRQDQLERDGPRGRHAR